MPPYIPARVSEGGERQLLPKAGRRLVREPSYPASLSPSPLPGPPTPSPFSVFLSG